MGRSWKIGTAFGIGLYVHWTFLLIPALLFWANSESLLGGLVSVGVVFALFGCVLLHELGHALMARSFGIPTRDITLYPIGGVARLEGMGSRPIEELAIAVAGPAVNVVIAAGLWIGLMLAGLTPQLSLLGGSLEGADSLTELILMTLLNANIILVLFNIIPAFPMDGGRVFRALLAMSYGRLRATEIAFQVAKFVAAAFIVSGLFRHVPGTNYQVSPMLALVGFFVLFAGRQELAMLRYQDARQRGLIGDEPWFVEPRNVIEMPYGSEAAPSEPDFSGFTWDPRHGVWIEWRNGRPVGACSVGRAGRPL